MNETIFGIEIVIVFSLLVLTKKLFGKTGLIGWIGIASIIANIQVTKSIDILGLSATLGNVMFGSNFLAANILSEFYGKEDAKKGILFGLFSVIVYLVMTQITLVFTPNEIDLLQDSMKSLFTIAPRVCISSVVMFFIANMGNIFIYNKMKNKEIKEEKEESTKLLWLRDNVSTIVCNCLENFGFVFGAFLGVYPIADVVMIAVSTSILEIIISICSTPFIYLAKKV